MTAETIDAPFTAFNFDVVLTPADPVAGVGQPVCRGSFSECDGLQLDLEPRSVAQGGVNDSVTHLVGPVRAGQLTLRRGMTSTPDLWAWMAAAGAPGRIVTADGWIAVLDAAHEVQATFVLTGCLPVRLRGPALNAQTGLLAIEELGLAVGRLELAGAAAPVGASVGVSATGGVQVSGGLGLSGRLGGTLSGSLSGSAGFVAGGR